MLIQEGFDHCYSIVKRKSPLACSGSTGATPCVGMSAIPQPARFVTDPPRIHMQAGCPLPLKHPSIFVTDLRHCVYDLQFLEEKAENEELRRTISNLKRKSTKIVTETEDLKLMLENAQTRNSELEKKQRK